MGIGAYEDVLAIVLPWLGHGMACGIGSDRSLRLRFDQWMSPLGDLSGFADFGELGKQGLEAFQRHLLAEALLHQQLSCFSKAVLESRCI